MNGNNGFMVQPAQHDFSLSGGGSGGGGVLQGLQGMFGGQSQPNAFASQTPGAPQQPGRVDQSSFNVGMQQPQMQGGQGGMDFMQMLAANIAKNFGGM